MKRTKWLQETRKIRFEEAYEGWQERWLTQEEAARLLGVCDRTFRRYLDRFDEEGLDGLLDKRLTQVSPRCAPVDEVMATVELYRSRYHGWNVKHFYTWYRQARAVQFVLLGSWQSLLAYANSGWQGGQDQPHSVWPGIETVRHRDDCGLFATGAGTLRADVSHPSGAAANRYLEKVYRPAFNAEFTQSATEQGTAFVPWIGGGLDDILCEQFERTVGNDNCVRFEGLILQIPADRHRCHYVTSKGAGASLSRRASGPLPWPRKLAEYSALGKEIKQKNKAVA